MLLNNYKKVILPLFMIVLLQGYAFCAEPDVAAIQEQTKTRSGFGAEKVLNLEHRLFVDHNDDMAIKEYISIQKKRSSYFRVFKKDNIEACDSLRAALYFLSKDKKSEDYIKTLAQLNSLIEKSCFKNDDYNRLEVAKNLYLEGKYYAAAYEFCELLNKDFESATCLEYLGDIEYQVNKNKDCALQYFTRCLEIEPNRASALFKTAKILNSQNRNDLALEYYTLAINSTDDPEILKEGINIFTHAIKKRPRNANLYEILGATYEKTGDKEKTYELYQRAIYLNPKDIFLKYRLGGLLYDTKKYNDAMQVYDKILKDNLYESQIRAGKAKSLIATDRTNEALKEYQVILAIYPDSKQAKYGIYNIFKGKDLDFIISNFYPLNEDFKPDSVFYADFAELLASFEQTKDAIELYKKAIALDSKNEKAYLKLYELYELEAKDANAYELMKSAYKNLPNSEEIKRVFFYLNKDATAKKDNLALSYLKNNEWAKAIKIYGQIEPKTPEVYVAIANCYKHLKDYTKSAQYYRKALDLNPKNSDVYYNLALIYLEQKSPKSAQTMLLKAIELDPKNVKALKLSGFLKGQIVTNILNDAYTYYDKKDYKRALEIINDAVKRYPDDAQARYYRAITLEALGMYQEATKDYRATVKLNRRFDLAYYSLARALEKTGRGKEALEAYEKYLAREPKHQELVKEAEKKVIELGEKYY